MEKSAVFLLLILLLAAALRFYQINTNPRALYGDGLTAVYDAYSLLKTGHDQKGNFLPLVFPLGGGRPAGYVYATIPFVALFGPTPLAAQIVSVLSGMGIVFLLYLLGKKLISKQTGLAIAAAAAFNPWELSMSRGPFESHFALFLTLLGIYFFLLSYKRQYFYLLFGVALGVALQTYATFRLTVPLLTVLLLGYVPLLQDGKKFQKLSHLKYFKKPFLVLSLLIIITSSALSIYLTVSRGKEDRFDIINIFKNQEIRSVISQKVKSERELSSLPSAISHALQIPHVEFTSIVAENYFQNLLPNFLFLHGDGQVRHNPAEMGGFFWIDALFIFLGIIYLYKIKRNLLILLTFWILIAPIPTTLVGGPHALRSSLLLPPLLILVGVGFLRLWSFRARFYTPVLYTALALLFIAQFIYFFDRFYFIAPQKNASSWSYPAKEAALLAMKNWEKYDYIFLSNDIDNMEFAYPFYAKIDPKLVIEQNQYPAKIDEYKLFKYGNIYIGSLPNTRVMKFIRSLEGTVLYIGADKEQPYLENYEVLRGFDYPADLVVTWTGDRPDLFLSHKE